MLDKLKKTSSNKACVVYIRCVSECMALCSKYEVHSLLHVASAASNVTITPVQVDPVLNCTEHVRKISTQTL